MKIICLGVSQCCPYRDSAKILVYDEKIEIADSHGNRITYRTEILTELKQFVSTKNLLPHELNSKLALNSIECTALINYFKENEFVKS